MSNYFNSFFSNVSEQTMATNKNEKSGNNSFLHLFGGMELI